MEFSRESEKQNLLPPRMVMDEYVDFIESMLRDVRSDRSQEQKALEEQVINRFSFINQSWDNVPEKVVGTRIVDNSTLHDAFELQDLVNDMTARKSTWPRGVFRFESYENAEEWWINEMIIRN